MLTIPCSPRAGACSWSTAASPSWRTAAGTFAILAFRAFAENAAERIALLLRLDAIRGLLLSLHLDDSIPRVVGQLPELSHVRLHIVVQRVDVLEWKGE